MGYGVGMMVWLLAALGVVAVGIFLERFFGLRRARIDFSAFVKGVVNVLERGGEDEALAICEETASPVSALMATALRQRHAPATVLREAVDVQGRLEVGRLDRRLAALAIIGQVAPVAGLFGTVLGFMRTLMMAQETAIVSRPELFTAALGALVSTALGLAVAICVTVMYGILRNRLERLIADLEAAASQIVAHLATAEVRT